MASNNRCYRLMTMSKDWQRADDDCMNGGGHLVSITSERENSVVYSLRGNSTSQYSDVWMGRISKDVQNKFKWIDGTDSSSTNYTNWASGEPDKPFESNSCVSMVSTGEWADVPCDWYKSYVCETSAHPATTQPPTTGKKNVFRPIGIAQLRSMWLKSSHRTPSFRPNKVSQTVVA